MSILITYKEAVFGDVPYVIKDQTQALAADALDYIFHTLNETTGRLERKLIDLSHVGTDEGDKLISQADARTTIADVWNLIDNVHRAIELLELLDYPFEEVEKQLLYKIGLIRNSYHHLKQRIGEHFVPNSGSVFGDLSWFHRSVRAGDDLWFALLASGVSIKEENGEISRAVEFTAHASLAELTGIFKVEHRYVIKPRPRDEPQTVIVDLSSVATLMNKIIARLERSALSAIEELKQMQKVQPEKHIGAGLPPNMINVMVTITTPIT